MFLFKIIKLELEESGEQVSQSRLNMLKQLLLTSSPEQQMRIRNRVKDRYKNKESLLSIIQYLETQLSIGIIH